MEALSETTVFDLDAGVLSLVLRHLDPPSLARGAVVCRAWREIVASDQLWLAMLESLEPCGFRHAPAWQCMQSNPRSYVSWRCNWWKPAGNFLVVDGADAGHVLPDLPRIIPIGSSEQQPRRLQILHQTGSNNVVESQQPTWSPTGRLLVCTVIAGPSHFMNFHTYVLVADLQGRPLLQLELPEHRAPFYYYWSACGNYLAMLSNWDARTVGLRVLDVASLLVPGGSAPRIAYVGASVPLYISWSPHEPRLYVHASCRTYALWDAREGQFQDCLPVTPGHNNSDHHSRGSSSAAMHLWSPPEESLPSCQILWTAPPRPRDLHLHPQWAILFGSHMIDSSAAPEWIADGQGGSRLLLPVVGLKPADVRAAIDEGKQLSDLLDMQQAASNSHRGNLVLDGLPFDAIFDTDPASAVGHWGHRHCHNILALNPSNPGSLIGAVLITSTHTQELATATNRQGSAIAWLSRGKLFLQPLNLTQTLASNSNSDSNYDAKGVVGSGLAQPSTSNSALRPDHGVQATTSSRPGPALSVSDVHGVSSPPWQLLPFAVDELEGLSAQENVLRLFQHTAAPQHAHQPLVRPLLPAVKPGNRVLGCQWSPDGRKLLVLLSDEEERVAVLNQRMTAVWYCWEFATAAEARSLMQPHIPTQGALSTGTASPTAASPGQRPGRSMHTTATAQLLTQPGLPTSAGALPAGHPVSAQAGALAAPSPRLRSQRSSQDTPTVGDDGLMSHTRDAIDTGAQQCAGAGAGRLVPAEAADSAGIYMRSSEAPEGDASFAAIVPPDITVTAQLRAPSSKADVECDSHNKHLLLTDLGDNPDVDGQHAVHSKTGLTGGCDVDHHGVGHLRPYSNTADVACDDLEASRLVPSRRADGNAAEGLNAAHGTAAAACVADANHQVLTKMPDGGSRDGVSAYTDSRGNDLPQPPSHQGIIASDDGGVNHLVPVRLVCGARFTPSGKFLRHYLPFFDQYKLSIQLWRPDSHAFCFPAESVTSEDGEELSGGIYIQELPPWTPPKAPSTYHPPEAALPSHTTAATIQAQALTRAQALCSQAAQLASNSPHTTELPSGSICADGLAWLASATVPDASTADPSTGELEAAMPPGAEQQTAMLTAPHAAHTNSTRQHGMSSSAGHGANAIAELGTLDVAQHTSLGCCVVEVDEGSGGAEVHVPGVGLVPVVEALPAEYVMPGAFAAWAPQYSAESA